MATVLIQPKNPTVAPGAIVDLTATISDAPAGATTDYEWKVGTDIASTDPIFAFSDSTAGTYNVSLKVTFTVAGEPPTVTSATDSTTVVVQAAIGSDGVRYIHPLDHRQSAFIWCGYWVLDEIQKAAAEGIDWKNPDATDLKYKLDLRTIAKMIQDYPNVEIQESRHGRIVHKSAIEAGVIY